MKRILLLLYLILLHNVSYSNPTRKVLFELNDTESIYWGEYNSNCLFSGYNYMCILRDNESRKFTLVWNGERKVVSDKYLISVVSVDFDNFNQSIYSYTTNNQSFINIDGELMGPYESCYYTGASRQLSELYRHCYQFKQMGEWYSYDYDGYIYKTKDGRYMYYSLDRQHRATITDDRRIVTINDMSYVLTFPVECEVESHNVVLFDDGSCYVYLEFEDSYRNSLNKYVWRTEYYITESEVIEVGPNQYFDWEIQSVAQKSKIRYNPDFGFFGELKFAKDKNTQNTVPAYEFALQDSRNKHFFSAKWDYDYVLIDGKKYGDQCPIEAFYDNEINAFVWVVIEGRQIIMYSYVL